MCDSLNLARPYRSLVVPEVQQAMDCANVESLRESRSRHPSSHFSSIALEVAVLIAEWVCPVKYTLDDIKNVGTQEGEISSGLQLRLNLRCLIVDRTRFSSNGLASREQVLGVMLDLEKVCLNQAKTIQGERLALKEIAN
ncbi:hypothetical protein N7449_008229 [Penicillium cf. viridicatum]|uniref:Uncharacterized protein n=1 Tax=Penicillium cf. viridicatum TaxID=2972119 RepID=A0A9W9J9K1_9EURO|nr:hypothetical protein N7449_008229 [Penicillium cf. viridicatum]